MTKDRLGGKKTLQVAGFLDELTKTDIKKEIDIIDLFSHFGVQLQKKGKTYTGLCPWHEDTNPSLSVDQEKGLYNCFGCGESGDIFSLTEKVRNVDFKGAVKYLQDFTSTSSRTGQKVKVTQTSTTPDRDEAGVIGDEVSTTEDKPKDEEKPQALRYSSGQTVSLTDVTNFYHKQLQTNKKGQAYLEKRGLFNGELMTRFKLGFVDGSLLQTLSEAQKHTLQHTGILNEKGTEHFSNCITFPVVDDLGQTVGVYGRSVNDKVQVKHLYLKGKHKGIFNRKASQVYDEIILTESIIDCLSLIQLGFENVQSIYGTNGFTDEHLQTVKDDRVKTIILAFDKDEAGKTATEKLTDHLLSEGLSVKVITPSTKDWNEYLVSGGDKKIITEQIKQANIQRAEEKQHGLAVTKDTLGYVFMIGDITYRVSGVKEIFVTNLRVNVKAALRQAQGDELKYFDNLDLYSARSRNIYSSNLGKHFDVEPKRIENDLIAILEYLERERDKHLSSGAEKETAVAEMSDSEKELGKKLLTNQNIYQEIIDDMTTLGYVGEDENKLLVWLAAVSRLLPKPLSVFIQSPPSTGKSFLLETLLRLLPEESAEWITSMSDQAFNYMDEEDFLDNVFMMGEALHNDVIEGYIRQMQSENKISRKVTIKDPQTGMMKTGTVKHDVRLVFMQTSTAMKVNIENLSRCLVLKVDASREQTERVQAMQRYKASYDGHLEERHVVPEIIKKHQSAQRLLKKIPVFNPFEKYIRFPSTRSIMRRGQNQFLGLLHASCVARQMQKKAIEKIDHYTGEIEYAYECDLVDYETVRSLFINAKLLQQDENLSSSVINLYEDIRTLVKKKAQKENIDPEDVSFIQTEVREITNLGHESVKRYMRILVEYEYIAIVSGRRHGTRMSYRLREDKPIHQVDIAGIIPTVEEIKEKLGKTG